jgi:hypothetical protein
VTSTITPKRFADLPKGRRMLAKSGVTLVEAEEWAEAQGGTLYWIPWMKSGMAFLDPAEVEPEEWDAESILRREA